VARETALWQPLLDWASLRYDAPLRVATGILPVAQPPHSLKALRTVVGSLGVLDLTAVADLTQTTGSLILALAVADGRIDAEAACAASLLDERFQAELWGEDVEALHRRRGVEADINAAARFLELLRD
jgi:chaperone required for assembly of F1-ATPase